MNNIEDLIQKGYFQQYKQNKTPGKRHARSDSRQVRGEQEQVSKKKKEIFVIFQESGISNNEAHLRGATAPKLELVE